MSESDPLDTLRLAWARLTLQWQDTRSLWTDEVAIAFERDFWWEITERTRAIDRSAEVLSDTLDRALESTE